MEIIVLVTVKVPAGSEPNVRSLVCPHKVDTDSQASALLAGLIACRTAGIDDALIEGVRLQSGSKVDLLAHEQVADCGLLGLARQVRGGAP